MVSEASHKEESSSIGDQGGEKGGEALCFALQGTLSISQQGEHSATEAVNKGGEQKWRDLAGGK